MIADTRLQDLKQTGPPAPYVLLDFDVPTLQVLTEGKYSACVEEIVRKILEDS